MVECIGDVVYRFRRSCYSHPYSYASNFEMIHRFFLWRGPIFGWHSVPTFSVLWGYLKKSGGKKIVAGNSYLSIRTIRCQGRWKLLSSILVSVPNTQKFEFVFITYRLPQLHKVWKKQKSMHHNHTLRNEFEASVWWFTNKNKKKREKKKKTFSCATLTMIADGK